MTFAPNFADAIVEKCGELVDQALPSEGVSGSVDTVSSDSQGTYESRVPESGNEKGYPEPQIPRGRSRAKHLGDEGCGVEPEVRSPSEAVALLKGKLGAEVVSRG